MFGMDARSNLIDIAESLENTEWECLIRPPKYEVKTTPLVIDIFSLGGSGSMGTAMSS